jgi:hypothetical protein
VCIGLQGRRAVDEPIIVRARTGKAGGQNRGLQSLDVAQLKAHWRTLYTTEAPARFSRDLLIRAVAYRLQERALGGLKPITRRLFRRIAADAPARRPLEVVSVRKLEPGAVLIREWGGIQHQVMVLEQGFSYRGQHYRSLSEVTLRPAAPRTVRAGSAHRRGARSDRRAVCRQFFLAPGQSSVERAGMNRYSKKASDGLRRGFVPADILPGVPTLDEVENFLGTLVVAPRSARARQQSGNAFFLERLYRLML